MDEKSEVSGGSSQARPVLVAVDFSSDSESALIWGVNYAHLISAPLIALHVIHDSVDNPGFYNKEGHSALLPLEEIAREKMDDFFQGLSENHPELKDLLLVDRKFATGIPAGRIVEVAANENAQIIVMGTRGRTGLSNLLLGSVAKQVLQGSAIPVVVLKSEQVKPKG